MFDGIQSALDPRGPGADVVAEITFVLVIGAAAVFLVVMALALWALVRRPRWLAGNAAIVGGGIVFPTVVLSALLVYTLVRANAITPQGEPALRIAITGHQWWWHVAYLTPAGEVDFVTANELRLPAGGTVELELRSADVLHSFWLPSLAGKLDLVPGKVNRLRFVAAVRGRYRGQCAEYCGGPHAQMAFYVVAEEEASFDRWRQRQRLPAEDSNALFNARCAACHTVRGTAAEGRLGPDLTHVGSRSSIGAGILPNNRGTIAAWIASSQHIKPGNLMPSFGELSAAELRELATYVQGLR